MAVGKGAVYLIFLIGFIRAENNECNLITSQMPESITFSLDNSLLYIHSNCSESESRDYQISLECFSAWCAKEIIPVGTARSSGFCSDQNSIKIPKRLQDFTEYRPYISSKDCKKPYNIISTNPGPPHEVRSLLAFCDGANSLKLEWQNPYPPTGIISGYHIFALAKDDKIKVNNTYQCDGRICANIANLKPGIVYTLSIKAKNNEIAGKPRILKISTKPDPNFDMSSAKFVNNFDVEVKNYTAYLKHNLQFGNDSCIPTTLTVILEKNETKEENFNFWENKTIQLEAGSNYSVRISTEGMIHTEAALKYISANTSEFSNPFFIKICSKDCKIKIPPLNENLKSRKYYVSLEGNDNELIQEDGYLTATLPKGTLENTNSISLVVSTQSGVRSTFPLFAKLSPRTAGSGETHHVNVKLISIIIIIYLNFY